jgi:hypothetical protein
MIIRTIRLEVQNGCIPRPYIELRIDPGEVSVIANSAPPDEINKTYLKFDEHEFVEFCREYICIVDEHKKRYE